MFGAAEPKLKPLDAALAGWADDIAARVSVARLRQCIKALPGPRSRLHWPEAMAQTDDLILNELRQAGWQAQRRPFKHTNIPGLLDHDYVKQPTVYAHLDGINIVAVREGESSHEAIVVAAHHDTVRNSPGADDNGSGVAALLELARVLAPCRFRRAVVLAALDMEELGLLGARALAPELTNERKVVGAIVFETMAYSSHAPNSQIVPPGLGALYPGQMKRIRSHQAVGDWTAVIYRGSSERLASHFAEGLVHLAGREACIALRDPADLPLIGGVLKRVVPAVHDFARSDHVPFWEAGVPAIQITDTANMRNPHYHKPTDTPDTLDYGRLAAIVGATAVVLYQVAGLVE